MKDYFLITIRIPDYLPMTMKGRYKTFLGALNGIVKCHKEHMEITKDKLLLGCITHHEQGSWLGTYDIYYNPKTRIIERVAI